MSSLTAPLADRVAIEFFKVGVIGVLAEHGGDALFISKVLGMRIKRVLAICDRHDIVLAGSKRPAAKSRRVAKGK